MIQVLPSSQTHRYADDSTLTDSCGFVSTGQLCMDLGFTKCDDTSSTRCSCPITTYHENDMRGSAADVCTSCDAGSYGDEPGLVGRCKMCPAGYHTALVGQALCLPCLPGKFGNETGLAECHKCAKGKMNAAPNATACGLPDGVLPELQPGIVPALSARKAATKRTCRVPRVCQGQDERAPNATACVDCQMGYYQDLASQGSCLPCLPGKFGSETDLPSATSATMAR